MTYVDIKYTSLFWKLEFVEETTVIYFKNYSGLYQIYIQAIKQDMDYRENTRSNLTLEDVERILLILRKKRVI
ncbi:hypothetical protein LCGC14_1241780 [marine sediment metagenome]|uniref:Uncharacterized protein n=1 Tax=marine sediment metagenome TaxID=412755 RepID=A0A0F9L9L9_9ZZZZ